MESTWTAPPVERPDPPRTTPEREALETWLDYHRATLLSKCEGLGAEALKERAIPPSRLSLLGLVRHMTDVERWWFSTHAAGRDASWVYYSEENPDKDFEDLGAADAEVDLAAFKSEIEASRRAVGDKELDHVVEGRDPTPERARNIRWIFVHMIEEYARHNGHADLLRERIDGKTGE